MTADAVYAVVFVIHGSVGTWFSRHGAGEVHLVTAWIYHTHTHRQTYVQTDIDRYITTM